MTQLRTPENSTLPIDSTSEIRQYKVVYGCGDIADPANDPLQIVVYIYDSRQDDGGNFFRNELFLLKDDKHSTLPDAYQFPDGRIRFFAFESQLPAVLTLLRSFGTLWLRTKAGRVFIVSGTHIY
ncbi:hypothetical protein [Celeribacter persicus]|uniref:Uncharacterized protein n=1 Tax=Celeribacter persicus TaxID=1651082 RepID=A0A2T5HBC0_9RHOB|nr:hypothetical protein [Celeribacter persicus]PTQ68868.1 hypothetical protein C8N42_1139 [Celeribacter persicus]